MLGREWKREIRLDFLSWFVRGGGARPRSELWKADTVVGRMGLDYCSWGLVFERGFAGEHPESGRR
jgi:hypothetical protein